MGKMQSAEKSIKWAAYGMKTKSPWSHRVRKIENRYKQAVGIYRSFLIPSNKWSLKSNSFLLQCYNSTYSANVFYHSSKTLIFISLRYIKFSVAYLIFNFSTLVKCFVRPYYSVTHGNSSCSNSKQLGKYISVLESFCVKYTFSHLTMAHQKMIWPFPYRTVHV